jgi:hypothetical protein
MPRRRTADARRLAARVAHSLLLITALANGESCTSVGAGDMRRLLQLPAGLQDGQKAIILNVRHLSASNGSSGALRHCGRCTRQARYGSEAPLVCGLSRRAGHENVRHHE